MSSYTFQAKSILVAPAIILSACAGQQVPMPSFPDNGMEFGGPTVSIGRPTMVHCPFTRPDGSYATFETEAHLCNELLSGGEDEAGTTTQPTPSLAPAAPSSPPVGTLSDGNVTPGTDRVAETAGGVCSLGKDRVIDTFYCDDLTEAQTRVQGVLGPLWGKLTATRKDVAVIWCYWGDCLWNDRLGTYIDAGDWLAVGAYMTTDLLNKVPDEQRNQLYQSMHTGSYDFTTPIRP